MTGGPTLPTRRRRRRRRPVATLIAVVVALVVVFAIGIALGQAIDENRTPASTQTLVRTLKPLPLVPAARETVTVTTSEP